MVNSPLKEIWLDIPFAKGYKASNLGRIIGSKGRILSPTRNHAGYLVCDLWYKQFRVNRIICETFHGKPPSDKHQAAHKDNNRQNNREDNLYWATPIENGSDLRLTNNKKGANSAAAKLCDEDVRSIRERKRDGESTAFIARSFPRICYATISHVVNGRTWTHIK